MTNPITQAGLGVLTDMLGWPEAATLADFRHELEGSRRRTNRRDVLEAAIRMVERFTAWAEQHGYRPADPSRGFTIAEMRAISAPDGAAIEAAMSERGGVMWLN
jgi:hypothetical protein